MRVQINGIATDKYTGNTEFLGAFKSGFENIDILDLESAIEAGLEANLIWEAAKLAGSAVKTTTKAAYHGQKAAGTAIKDARLNWNTKIKPAIIKVLKEFQIQLQNMWSTYRKYDSKYKELGKEINTVINVFGGSITSLPRTKLSWHAFDANSLVGYMEIIQNYDEFMTAVQENRALFPNKMVKPNEFANFAQNNNVRAAQDAVNGITEAVGNLKRYGDLGLIRAFWEDKRSPLKAFSKFDKRLMEAAYSEKTSITEFTEATILRGMNEKYFDSSNIVEFRNDFLNGSNSYLQCMRAMLNKDIITNILTKGGDSIKKRTKTDLADMEKIVKIGLDKQMRARANNSNANTTQNSGSRSSKKEPNLSDTAEQSLNADAAKAAQQTKLDQGGESVDAFEAFADFFKSKANSDNGATAEKGKVMDRYEGQYSPDSDPISIVELTDQYIQAYTLLMSNVANNYSSMVRGTLSATYTLIQECTQIVAFMKSAVNEQK